MSKNKRKVTQFVCVFWFIFEEKSTWFYSMEYLHACVFRLMYKYVCLFLYPWHRCDVFERSQCRMDNFPSDETIFIIIFLLSALLLLLLLFVKMEHTHIYINKNFVAQTFRCRHNALLFTLAQTIFLVSEYVCVLGCYCFYFPVVLPFFQLSFSLSLNDLLVSVYAKRLQRKWSFYFNSIYNLYLYTHTHILCTYVVLATCVPIVSRSTFLTPFL